MEREVVTNNRMRKQGLMRRPTDRDKHRGRRGRLSASVRSACVSGYQPPHGSPGLVLLMQHADLVTGLPPRHSNMCASWSCTPGQREGELSR